MYTYYRLPLTVAVLIVVAFAASANGETDKDRLGVGSKAPALDVEHWISDGDGKFSSVSQFKPGHVYVVEFWATWCRPCVASMPHLSELQKKYQDKDLQIISISDEDLETVQAFLERPTREDGASTFAQLTSNYCLTTDPDSSSHVDYLKAAQQDGIPSAFIVGKSGVIEWIGHPMEIDEPLDQVINERWDRVAYVKKKEAEERVSADIEKRVREALRSMREGDSDKATETLDGLISEYAKHPAIDQLKGLRFQILLSLGGEKAAQAMIDFTSDVKDPEILNEIAWMVVEMKNDGQPVDEKMLQSATKVVRDALKMHPTTRPSWIRWRTWFISEEIWTKRLRSRRKPLKMQVP